MRQAERSEKMKKMVIRQGEVYGSRYDQNGEEYFTVTVYDENEKEVFFCGGGWRAKDREQLMQEHELTEDEANSICAELKKMDGGQPPEGEDSMDKKTVQKILNSIYMLAEEGCAVEYDVSKNAHNACLFDADSNEVIANHCFSIWFPPIYDGDETIEQAYWQDLFPGATRPEEFFRNRKFPENKTLVEAVNQLTMVINELPPIIEGGYCEKEASEEEEDEEDSLFDILDSLNLADLKELCKCD
jgi:hypothetical protein